MNFFDKILYYIALPFGYLMKFCCWISPGHNYIIALIFFTVIIQVLLCLIFGIKQQKNMQKQASIAPKAAAIRKKYAGRNDKATQQKMQQETMELYSEHGYSPMGGCLPMLIQLPIIMALYYVVVYPMQYICLLGKEVIGNMVVAFRDAGFLSEAAVKALGDSFTAESALTNTRAAQVEIINQVSRWNAEGQTEMVAKYAPELAGKWLPDYKVGFLDFSVAPPYPNNPDFKTLWPLLLVPVLIVATMILSQLLTRKFSYQDPTMKEQQNNCSMKVMTYSMPLLSAWISFSLPAAVGVYWIYRSIAATLQQFIMSKIMPMPTFTEEDYKAAERELMGSSKKKKNKNSSSSSGSPDGTKKRSLHHIDDDDDETPAVSAPKKSDGAEDTADEKAESGESASDSGEKPEDADAADKSDKSDTKAAPLDGDVPVIKEDKGKKQYKKK